MRERRERVRERGRGRDRQIDGQAQRLTDRIEIEGGLGGNESDEEKKEGEEAKEDN